MVVKNIVLMPIALFAVSTSSYGESNSKQEKACHGCSWYCTEEAKADEATQTGYSIFMLPAVQQ